MCIGFTFGALNAAAGSDTHLLNMTFLAVNACSMGFGLLCITSSTLCLIFGQQRALLGGGGSEDGMGAMDTAIKILKGKS
jgi:hypothetical protein